MTKRVEFCKTINGMFEDGELCKHSVQFNLYPFKIALSFFQRNFSHVNNYMHSQMTADWFQHNPMEHPVNEYSATQFEENIFLFFYLP